MDAQKFISITCQTHIFLKLNGPSFRLQNEGLSSSGELGGIGMIVSEGLCTGTTGLIEEFGSCRGPRFMSSSSFVLEE